MSRAFLVQILVPKETGKGQPVTQGWFECFLEELTRTFGGATSFLRAPGQGLWRESGETELDTIAVIEVMAEQLEQEYWSRLRQRLQHELSQDEVVIRAQEIIRI
jgi:hypothetical protein